MNSRENLLVMRERSDRNCCCCCYCTVFEVPKTCECMIQLCVEQRSLVLNCWIVHQINGIDIGFNAHRLHTCNVFSLYPFYWNYVNGQIISSAPNHSLNVYIISVADIDSHTHTHIYQFYILFRFHWAIICKMLGILMMDDA